MRYSVSSEVFALNPELCFGIIIGKGLKNSESTAEDIEMLRNAENYVRQLIKPEELRDHPIVRGYRDTMGKAGINPNKFPPSTEAMLKRVLKGASLPNINALVDLCNAVSIENMISLGGHDLKDIKEDLSVRFTRGTERFLPFGASEYEPVESGELVFTSGDIVQTRKWIWRQSELGKITLDTSNVFFQLVGFEDNAEGPLIKSLESLEKLITERFSGSYQRFIVSKSCQEIEFM